MLLINRDESSSAICQVPCAKLLCFTKYLPAVSRRANREREGRHEHARIEWGADRELKAGGNDPRAMDNEVKQEASVLGGLGGWRAGHAGGAGGSRFDNAA